MNCYSNHCIDPKELSNNVKYYTSKYRYRLQEDNSGRKNPLWLGFGMFRQHASGKLQWRPTGCWDYGKYVNGEVFTVQNCHSVHSVRFLAFSPNRLTASELQELNFPVQQSLVPGSLTEQSIYQKYHASLITEITSSDNYTERIHLT